MKDNRISAVIALIIGIGMGAAMLTPANAEGQQISACANKKSGVMRLSNKCTAGETRLQWNVQGVQGVPGGPNGDKGPEGDKGPVGDKGPQGDKGLTGDKGPTGDRGPAGPQGIAGPQGPSGTTTVDSGSVTINYLTSSWSCGSTFLAGLGSSVSGNFGNVTVVTDVYTSTFLGTTTVNKRTATLTGCTATLKVVR